MAETKVTGRELADDYSTNEVNTGRKWIDGKPIYRKTVSFGALPNSAQKQVAHGITNVEYFVRFDAMSRSATGTTFSLPWVNNTNSTSGQISLHLDATNINIFATTDRTSLTTTFVTLEYTKT